MAKNEKIFINFMPMSWGIDPIRGVGDMGWCRCGLVIIGCQTGKGVNWGVYKGRNDGVVFGVGEHKGRN